MAWNDETQRLAEFNSFVFCHVMPCHVCRYEGSGKEQPQGRGADPNQRYEVSVRMPQERCHDVRTCTGPVNVRYVPCYGGDTCCTTMVPVEDVCGASCE